MQSKKNMKVYLTPSIVHMSLCMYKYLYNLIFIPIDFRYDVAYPSK